MDSTELSVNSLLLGAMFGAILVLGASCIGDAVRRRLRGTAAPRRRYFTGFVLDPAHAEAFCRENPDTFTAAEAYRLLNNDWRPSDPDLGAFGHVLARMQHAHPGRTYVFRMSPLESGSAT